MTLLIVGAGGQVGRELCRLAKRRGLEYRAFTRAELDIRDRRAVEATVAGAGAVINAAAYTAVDRAESDAETAFAVNRDGPARLAEACARRGVPLVHLSTDYVFAGDRTAPYREDDAPAPLNVYGASKAAGETAVRLGCWQHLILRTSWVFAAHGQNFVRTMLRLGIERSELAIVADQRGGPTAAADVAMAILHIVEVAGHPDFRSWGTYHYCGAPEASWFDFASAIFAGRSRPRLRRITTADHPTPARRPVRAVLDCSRTRATFGIAQPDWRQSLRLVLAELSEGVTA